MPRPDWKALAAAATEARTHAHAKYSGFRVGAAALCTDGSIVVGCNVENATFGLTVCAERNVASRAVLEGKQLLALAVVTGAEQPTPPCGMCRQVLAEFAGPELPIQSVTLAGVTARYTLGALLPHAFTSASVASLGKAVRQPSSPKRPKRGGPRAAP